MTAVVQCLVSAGDSGDKYGCQYFNVILKCEICFYFAAIVIPSVPALQIWHSRCNMYLHCRML